MPNANNVIVTGARVDTKANFEAKKRNLNPGELVILTDERKLIAMDGANGMGFELVNTDGVDSAVQTAMESLLIIE